MVNCHLPSPLPLADLLSPAAGHQVLLALQ
jgi:hypothetical protein